ncbi:MAG: hypothetical protein RL571_226 [Pseudomonadota bacterium]|jgi:hypothetical protein
MRMIFLALNFLLASQSQAHILISHENFESLHNRTPWPASTEANMKGSFNLANIDADVPFKLEEQNTSLNLSLGHLGSNTHLISTETSILLGLGISALLYRRRKLQF